MPNIKTKDRGPYVTLLLGLLAAAVVVMIMLFPDAAFRSSLEGLSIWWNFVFPALLPFLILSELCIGFGLVHGLGALMEPLMRLVFGIPGIGGWALAMGLTAGQPSGAAVTAQLEKQRLLTQTEAEKLLGVSHLSSPVLMVTVIGTGFLHSPKLGIILALVHYLSAFLTGLLWRGKPGRRDEERNRAGHGSLLARSLFAMKEAQRNDSRSFGRLLGDSVTSSVQSLMLIGGYMIMFSVLLHVIRLTRLFQHLPLADRLMSGLLEVHLGSFALTNAPGVPALFQTAALGALLGWGGLSSHLQAKSLLQGSGVRYSRFALFRLVHSGLAVLLTAILWKPLNYWLGTSLTVFGARHDGLSYSFHAVDFLKLLPGMFAAGVLFILAMLAVSILVALIHKSPDGA